MAMSDKMLCGMCHSRNVSTPPVIWCSECDDGFCTDCKEHHSVLKLSRNHTTIPIEEYQQLPSFIREINLFCEMHSEKFQIFCKKHDCSCCSKCVVESHNDCKEISSLDDVIRNAKTSVSFDENRSELEDMNKNIVKIRKSQKGNLGIITDQRKRIEEDILETRKKINNRLDELQYNILKEVNQIADVSSDKIQQTLSSLAQLEEKVKETQLNMTNITKFASQLQAFLGLKQIGNDVFKSDSALNDIINSGDLSKRSLSYTFDDTLQSIFDNVGRFGTVTVQTKPSDLAISKTKDKQAQNMMAEIRLKTIDSIKLKMHTKYATQPDFKTTGCIILSSGDIVYSCYTSSGSSTSRLISLAVKDSDMYNIKLKSTYAGDLAAVDDVTIAVASGGSRLRCINMVDLNTKDALRRINTDVLTDGILFKDGNIVCCARERGLVKVDIADGSMTQIVSNALSSYSYVAGYNDMLYYTHRTAGTVTCSDYTGNTIWEFKDDVLKEPKGITIDAKGNIYVVGCKSENVVVISSDGKQFRELLSKQDGLERPTVLHFDKSSDRLLVANEYKFAFLFSSI